MSVSIAPRDLIKPLIKAIFSQPLPWRRLCGPVWMALAAYLAAIPAHLVPLDWPALLALCGLAQAAVHARLLALHVTVTAHAYALTAGGGVAASILVGADRLIFNVLDPRGSAKAAAWYLGGALLLTPLWVFVSAHARKNPKGVPVTIPAVVEAPAPALVVVVRDPEAERIEASLAGKFRGVTVADGEDIPNGRRYLLTCDEFGTEVSVLLHSANTIEHLIDGPFLGSVRLERPHDLGVRQCHLYVTTHNSLGDLYPMPDEHGPLTIKEALWVAYYSDAADVMVKFSEEGIFLGGKRGAGKTGGIHVILHQLSRCVDNLTIVIAAEKIQGLAGPWLTPWALGRADQPPIWYIARTAEEIVNVLRFVLDLGRLRNEDMHDTDAVRISPEVPHIEIIVDELPALTGTAEGPQIAAMLSQVQEVMRAAGVDVIMGAQRIVAPATGGRRTIAQVGTRILMGTADRSEAALMQGGRQAGQTRVDQLHDRGSFMLEGQGTRTAPARFPWLICPEDDANGLGLEKGDVSRLVAAAEAHAPLVPGLTGAEAELAAKYGLGDDQRWAQGTGARLIRQIRTKAGLATPVTDDAMKFLAAAKATMTAAGTDRLPYAETLAGLRAAGWPEMTAQEMKKRMKDLGVMPRQCRGNGPWEGTNPWGYWVENIDAALKTYG